MADETPARLKVHYFLTLVARANRAGIATKPYLWLAKGLLWAIPPGVCPRWLAKLALKLIDELAKRSRADADARFAMEVLKIVHVGDRDYSPYPMFREHIVEQMGREPDEEIPHDGGAMIGRTRVMLYSLPSGCRLWFNAQPNGIVVGGGIMQPEDPDGDMFWNRSKPVT